GWGGCDRGGAQTPRCDGCPPPLHQGGRQGLGQRRVGQRGVRRFGQYGLAWPRPLLKALRQVDRVTYQGVLEVLLGAEHGGGHRAGGYADAELEERKALVPPTPVHLS